MAIIREKDQVLLSIIHRPFNYIVEVKLSRLKVSISVVPSLEGRSGLVFVQNISEPSVVLMKRFYDLISAIIKVSYY